MGEKPTSLAAICADSLMHVVSSGMVVIEGMPDEFLS